MMSDDNFITSTLSCRFLFYLTQSGRWVVRLLLQISGYKVWNVSASRNVTQVNMQGAGVKVNPFAMNSRLLRIIINRLKNVQDLGVGYEWCVEVPEYSSGERAWWLRREYTLKPATAVHLDKTQGLDFPLQQSSDTEAASWTYKGLEEMSPRDQVMLLLTMACNDSPVWLVLKAIETDTSEVT